MGATVASKDYQFGDITKGVVKRFAGRMAGKAKGKLTARAQRCWCVRAVGSGCSRFGSWLGSIQWVVKFRILASLVQVSGMFGSVFDIKYPPFYSSLLESVSSAISLEVASFVPIDCVIPLDYIARMVFHTGGITVVIGLLYGTAWVFDPGLDHSAAEAEALIQSRTQSIHRPRRRSLSGGEGQLERRSSPSVSAEDIKESPRSPTGSNEGTPSTGSAKRRSSGGSDSAPPLPLRMIVSTVCSNAAFYTIYLAYPGVIEMVLSYYICVRWDQPGEDKSTYLRADMSIDCESSRYLNWRAYATLMVVLYPLGVPVFCA